ncbi:MAG: MBOAT family O-acyltransferase [Caldilineaceae bacterium]
MQFNSAEFLLFFPAVLIVYFALPHRWRWVLLLGASYFFYMAWRAEYALLLLFSTVVDYAIACGMESTESLYRRRLLLATSLVTNLGLLFAFKYVAFFGRALQDFLPLFNSSYQVPIVHLLLPVGISFYTFQTLSYTIDVYRGTQKAERHLGIFALYVAFFPQLVAGPIERSTRLLPQFFAEHQFDYAQVASGLRRMAWGFFKKVVIADKAALIVDAIYNQPTAHSGFTLLIATYLFAIQIYCDFSGYSDIAIGAARTLGFDLMENFHLPYLAHSIADFWRRWHISLSTWFRDYLYIPLGGNRVGQTRHYLNLFIVFLVSGLWHGASWTFVIWGALHGIYFLLELVLTRPLSKFVQWIHLDRLPTLLHWIRIAVVFHLVVFAWIFFRAHSVGDALYIIGQIVGHLPVQVELTELHLGYLTYVVLALAIGFMLFIEAMRARDQIQLTVRPLWVRWGAYYLLLMIIVLFGELNAKGQFIYFQF